MKTKLALTLAIVLILGGIQLVPARTGTQIKVKVGQQLYEKKSILTIKFVEVLEDSRCPEGANCIWEGNAKVKFSVRKGTGAWKTLEISSSLDPQKIVFEGYEIRLASLKPHPKAKVPIKTGAYVATFSITRVTR